MHCMRYGEKMKKSVEPWPPKPFHPWTPSGVLGCDPQEQMVFPMKTSNEDDYREPYCVDCHCSTGDFPKLKRYLRNPGTCVFFLSLSLFSSGTESKNKTQL